MSEPWSIPSPIPDAEPSMYPSGSDVEVALTDQHGVIVEVNAAWERFSVENGGDPARTGVGVNYLDVCDLAKGDPAVDAIAAALRSALSGELAATVHVEIPCHGPNVERWFDVLISARTDRSGTLLGATISLSPAKVGDSPATRGPPSVPVVDDPFRRVALVARAMSEGLELDEIVTIVVRQGMAGVGAEAATLALLDQHGVLQPVAVLGCLKPPVAAVGKITLDRELPMAVAVRDKRPVWIPSRADGEQHFPDLAAADPASQAWAALPLEIHGTAIGALGVGFHTAHEFTETDRLFLRALADLTALAVHDTTLVPTDATHEKHLAFASAVLNGAPDGIIVCDTDGRIVLANNQIEADFGYTRDQLTGRPIEVLLPERSRAFHHAFRRDYLAAPTTRPMGEGRVFLGRSADGRELPVEIGLAPITTDAGSHIVAVVRQVSTQPEPQDTENRAAQHTGDLHDRVVRRLVGAAVSLTTITSRPTLDHAYRDQLRHVIDQLDRTVEDLLTTTQPTDPHHATPHSNPLSGPGETS